MKFCGQCGGSLSKNGVCDRCGAQYDLRKTTDPLQASINPSYPQQNPVNPAYPQQNSVNPAYPQQTPMAPRMDQTLPVTPEYPTTPSYPTAPAYSAAPTYYAEPAAPEKKKNKAVWIAVICIILAVVLVGGAVAAVVLLGGDKDEDKEESTSESSKKKEEPEEDPTEEPNAGTKVVGGNTETPEEPEEVTVEYDESGECGNEAQWGFTESTGELYIWGEGEMDDYEQEYSDDYSRAYTTAPWGNLAVKSVRVEGLQYIGEYAFASCAELEEAELDDTVTTLGEGAFTNCMVLDEVTLSDGLTSIGKCAFDCCSELKRIELPDSLQTIGVEAFSLSGLTEVEIPASVTSIEEEAFSFADLTDITVEQGNVYYKDIDGVLFTKDGRTLIQYPPERTNTTYIVPDGVETIGTSAFMSNYYLEYVELSADVTTVEEWGFGFADSLETIYFPVGLETIEANAFYDAAILTIYFGGEQGDWDLLCYNIGEGNEVIFEASVYGPATPDDVVY